MISLLQKQNIFSFNFLYFTMFYSLNVQKLLFVIYDEWKDFNWDSFSSEGTSYTVNLLAHIKF